MITSCIFFLLFPTEKSPFSLTSQAPMYHRSRDVTDLSFSPRDVSYPKLTTSSQRHPLHLPQTSSRRGLSSLFQPFPDLDSAYLPPCHLPTTPLAWPSYYTASGQLHELLLRPRLTSHHVSGQPRLTAQHLGLAPPPRGLEVKGSVLTSSIHSLRLRAMQHSAYHGLLDTFN